MLLRSFKSSIVLFSFFLLILSPLTSFSEEPVRSLLPTPPHHSSSAPGYCSSYGGSHLYEYIQDVSYSQKSIDTLAITVYIYIANPTGCVVGEPCPEYDDSPEYVNVWIDWDGDKVFEDDEKVIDAALTGYHDINYFGTMSTSTILTIPPNAVSSTWMRVNLGWGHDPNNPCEQHWTWGDIIDKEVQITPLELRISQLEALQDFDIKDNQGNKIKDPIWTDDNPSKFKPIADGIKDGFWFITWPGSFIIKATIEASPEKPSWTPKVQYSWNISGTNKQETGVLPLKDSPTGWTGKFEVQMPDKVGKYTLNLAFSIYDDKGNKINSQSMSHTLYAVYKDSLISNPQTNWLEKVTKWAKNALNPTEVVSKITHSITYIPKWTYKGWGPNSPYVPGIKLVNDQENHGSCGSFKEALQILCAINGIAVGEELIIHPLPFLTVKPLISLDGNTGNAYEDGKNWPDDRDRWVFGDHVVGKFKGKYYDPTFRDNIGYTDVNKNIYCWGESTRYEPDGTFYIYCNGKHPTKIYPEPDNSPQAQLWGRWRYKFSSTNSSNHSLHAEFTGNFYDYGLDIDNNGLYDFLTAEAEIEVIDPGFYSILGILSHDSTIISMTTSSAYLNSGKQILKFYFKGKNIFQTKINGPYNIEAILYDENGHQIDNTSFTTSFYDYNTYQGLLLVEFEDFTDYGKDTDSDSLFNYLTIKLTTNVIRAGNYTIIGTLFSNEMKKIASLVYSSYLNEGIQEIYLNFEGTMIRKSKVNGPYIVNILLMDKNYKTKYKEFQTIEYNYTDFQLPLQKFIGNYADYGIDTNGNGLFDYLAVNVELEITTSGEYTIEGWLYDGDGNPIEIASITEHLNEGLQTVTLNFNGISIYQNQVNGPYYVKYLTLRGSGIMDFVEDAYTTSSYEFTKFEKPPVPLVALTGNYSDYGKDIDGNGIFDYLTIEAEVMVADSGNVVIKGRLMDVNGEEIVWAENTAYLEAGEPQIIELNFDGDAIYDHKVDGPYYLKDVYIYHTGDPSQADYVKDAYTTDFYPYTAFGEAEVPGDLDSDGDVDQNDLNILLTYRNQPASACPECDIDGDGVITVLDARKLVLLCTRPRCATE